MVLYLAMDSIPILRLSNPILFLLPIHPTRPSYSEVAVGVAYTS
jgi:hypothetical protein